MIKTSHLLLAAAAIGASAGCNAEKGSNSTGGAPANVEAVAPPEGGDWTQMVTQTPEGGFLMGNPNAAVKLVEFGSMTCPHCAEFDEKATAPLQEYVKSGRVSYEFRNFVRDPFDLTASLIARCGGAQTFFPLTHALYESQKQWVQDIQNASEQQMQQLTSLPPQQQFVEIAKLANLQQWAAQRGLPSSKSAACLTNQAEVDRLVQMTSDAVSTYNVPGTPAFLINGELVGQAATWEALEPKIKEALGS